MTLATRPALPLSTSASSRELIDATLHTSDSLITLNSLTKQVKQS
jgi:hypothetical protein